MNQLQDLATNLSDSLMEVNKVHTAFKEGAEMNSISTVLQGLGVHFGVHVQTIILFHLTEVFVTR